MKVTEIRVECTRKIAEFEKDVVSMVAVPEDSESAEKCAADLKKAILSVISGKETKIEDKGKVVVTKEKPQKQQEPQEANHVSETSKESSEEVSQKSDEESQKASEEEVVVEKPKKERKPETEKKPRTVSKTKKTSYDRNLDTHKNLLGSFLDKELGNWRSGDLLKKAGAASRKLDADKVDFLDENGEILDSFKEAFLALVKE